MESMKISSSNVDKKDVLPHYTSNDEASAYVLLSGKTRFNSEKFHIKNDEIINVCCGDEHTGVVTESGRIFMLGSNNWGQLGLGHEKNVEKPSCIKALKHEKVKLIACGRNHTVISSESGYLYAFGSNSECQLGLGEVTNQVYSSPQKIPLESKSWKQLSAGASYSCALTEKGELYVWGLNEYGELGIENASEIKQPKLVSLDFKVVYVSCGYYHTAIVSDDGKLYTCGSNESGQLGLNEKTSNINKFKKVLSIKERVTQVACGGQHTLVLTGNGNVYSFGDGSKGQLGLGIENENVTTPKQIIFQNSLLIKQISSGESHSAFVTRDGHLFTCGDNSHGKLGLEQSKNHAKPTKVEKYSEFNVNLVACGGCHMVILATLLNLHQKAYNSNLNSEKNNLQTGLGYKTQSLDQKNNENVKKDGNTHSSSEAEEMDDLENSFTFNRTHTLTKENKFLPVSEINLKKVVEQEDIKNKNKDALNGKPQTKNQEHKIPLSKYSTSITALSDPSNQLKENYPKKINNIRKWS